MTIREECVSHTLFLCMMHEISIPYTVISSAARNLPCTLLFLAPFAKGFQFYFVTHTTLYRCARKIEGFARDDVAEVAFSQHILYTGRGLSIPPYRHFERSREIFLALCSFLLPLQKVSPFPLSHIQRYTGVQERSLSSARDDDTGIALSKHILYTMRGISPYDAKEKSPGRSRSFFCVRKTYLPNCASMVPAATAVPITPATFGPIACIKR